MRAARSRGRSAGAALTAVAAALSVLALTTGGAFGAFSARIENTTDTAGTAPYFTCGAAETADRSTALFQDALTEGSGATVATDSSGQGNNGVYQGPMTASSSAATSCSRDGGTAWVLNGTSNFLTTNVKLVNPTTFTIAVWFRTTAASGKLIGFGSSQTGSSGTFDRHIYLTTAGKLTFGIYNGGANTITSTASYTDGAWHQAVATLSPAGTANAGMTLYVDGRQVAANSAFVTPQNTTGWWRAGWDAQGSWPGIGTNAYFTGSMRRFAVYTSAFTANQVLYEWAAGQ